MNEIKVYEVPETNIVEGELVVKRYDEAVKVANEYIASLEIDKLVVDENNYKEMKKQATNLNKINEALNRQRIDCVNDFTTNYQENMKALQEIFVNARTDLVEKIKEYESTFKSAEPAKPKVKTFIVKFYDDKEIEKLKKFCEENKLGWEIK